VVAVVGAGLSGLTAAFRLVRAGVDVVVLEARERVGGRAWRRDVGGLPFDAGCEALDDAHHALLGIAAELAVPVRRGQPWPHGEPPPELEAEIAALAARIDPNHPEDAEDAEALDRQTLGGWLRERGATQDVLEAAEIAYSVASSTVPIDEMSLLAYATKVAAGAAPNGLALRFEGGPSALATRLAEECEVRTRAVVTAVEQESAAVRLVLADGTDVRGDRAILAVPLTMLRDVRFEPPLPEHRQLALGRARYGEAVKGALPYAEDVGPLPNVSRDGVLYRPHPDMPLLALFAGASAAERARRREALALVDWSRERWTRGSYLIFGPGQLTTWGRRLADPHGRVHFAGTETSNLGSYMEGAVRAGERVAEEVFAAS
jgi:monoamine oxidase